MPAAIDLTENAFFVAGSLALIVGGFVLSLSLASSRHKERMRRLALLEAELQRPDLDAATRRELLQALVQQERRWSWLRNPSLWGKLWFGAGWILFVFAGGMLLLDYLNVQSLGEKRSLIAAAICGLAMLSLPLGLAELRRRAVAENR